MKLLVSGGREGFSRMEIDKVLGRYLELYGEGLVIIEGCARGVDTQAFEWAKIHNVPVLHYPAPWDHVGRRAGPWRNRAMLKILQPDEVVCFHANINLSKGTRDMAEISIARGVPTQVVGSTLE